MKIRKPIFKRKQVQRKQEGNVKLNPNDDTSTQVTVKNNHAMLLNHTLQEIKLNDSNKQLTNSKPDTKNRKTVFKIHKIKLQTNENKANNPDETNKVHEDIDETNTTKQERKN